MGYQESLMFCDTKRDMMRLCKLLNKVATDTSEKGLKNAGLDIFEVARLKKDVNTWHPGQGDGPNFPKGCYFVWLGGERGPQTGDALLDSHYTGRMPYWNTVFAEYLDPPAPVLLSGIEEGRGKGFQENEWIRTFQPGEDNQISLELIEQL